MESKKILVVFNICGISGRERVENYIISINSILNQNYDNFRVIISSCLNSVSIIDRLLQEFGDKVSYNIINERHPVNVTFNHSILKMVRQNGKYDAYLYVDSGITFSGPNDLKEIVELHFSGPNAMTAARVDSDSGVFDWFKKGANPQDESGQKELFQNGHFTVPIGKTLNMHAILFDNILFETYGNVMPDIFAAYCTESIFSYLSASVKRNFIVHKDIIFSHIVGMDGASSGFNPYLFKLQTGKPHWAFLYKSPKTIKEILLTKEVQESGMGYEEVEPWKVLEHDPKMFDEQHHSINPLLLQKAIKENFYLSRESLDYLSINSVFTP